MSRKWKYNILQENWNPNKQIPTAEEIENECDAQAEPDWYYKEKILSCTVENKEVLKKLKEH